MMRRARGGGAAAPSAGSASHPAGTARSVVILTASVGGGHDGPARELHRRLLERGHRSVVVDLAELAPMRLGQLLRAVFRAQLLIAPSWWGRAFRRLDRVETVPRFIELIAGLAARRVSQLLAGDDEFEGADVVVGTFPAAGHVIAASRRFGTVTPLVTYVTDPAVHRLWITADTALYLTGWLTGPDDIARHTSTPALAVKPAVRPEFTRPGSFPVGRSGNRDSDVIRFGQLLPERPLAMLSSGAWAVGKVRRTAIDLMTHTGYTPVVLCGSNHRLHRRLQRIPGVIALGWVSDMTGLMARVEVAVLNSGGLTLAEAVSYGLPVVHYRPLPGQGTANARTCETARVAPWARSAPELADAVAEAIRRPPPTLPGTDPITAILGVAGRHHEVRDRNALTPAIAAVAV